MTLFEYIYNLDIFFFRLTTSIHLEWPHPQRNRRFALIVASLRESNKEVVGSIPFAHNFAR